jgi:hypothetical protein
MQICEIWMHTGIDLVFKDKFAQIFNDIKILLHIVMYYNNSYSHSEPTDYCFIALNLSVSLPWPGFQVHIFLKYPV